MRQRQPAPTFPWPRPGPQPPEARSFRTPAAMCPPRERDLPMDIPSTQAVGSRDFAVVRGSTSAPPPVGSPVEAQLITTPTHEHAGQRQNTGQGPTQPWIAVIVIGRFQKPTPNSSRAVTSRNGSGFCGPEIGFLAERNLFRRIAFFMPWSKFRSTSTLMHYNWPAVRYMSFPCS